jgi:hypothetical protein
MSDETPDILTSSPAGEPDLLPDAVREPAAGKKKRGKAGARAATAAIEARIGHRFADPAILVTAFTHVSALKSARKRGDSYQRLEFLGDHVLGLIVSDMLYRAFPGADEGELSKRLADLVRKESCADVAKSLGLLDDIKLGAVGAGGALGLVNFRWLAARAVAVTSSGAAAGGAWSVGAGLRLAALAVACGALLGLEWAHPVALLAGLGVLPCAVVVEGLRGAGEER